MYNENLSLYPGVSDLKIEKYNLLFPFLIAQHINIIRSSDLVLLQDNSRGSGSKYKDCWFSEFWFFENGILKI